MDPCRDYYHVISVRDRSHITYWLRGLGFPNAHYIVNLGDQVPILANIEDLRVGIINTKKVHVIC